MQSVRVLRFIVAKSIIDQMPVQSNANCSLKSAGQQLSEISEITVAKWMMNMYTCSCKSMAQEMHLFS